MAFLEDNCILDVLTEDILEKCHLFVCGDDDMDEFFQKDALSIGASEQVGIDDMTEDGNTTIEDGEVVNTPVEIE